MQLYHCNTSPFYMDFENLILFHFCLASIILQELLDNHLSISNNRRPKKSWPKGKKSHVPVPFTEDMCWT